MSFYSDNIAAIIKMSEAHTQSGIARALDVHSAAITRAIDKHEKLAGVRIKCKFNHAKKPFAPLKGRHTEYIDSLDRNLMLIRLDRGMSRLELSKASGLQVAHIQQLESGTCKISSATILKLCKALRCTSTDLLGF